MTEFISLETKTGGEVSITSNQIKTPRALLAFTLKALRLGARRHIVVEMIQSQGLRLGLELTEVETGNSRSNRKSDMTTA